MTDLDDDVQVFAATLFGEAESELHAGRVAVASVVMNRYRSSLVHPRHQFGIGTIRSTCLASSQFSCWNAGTARRGILLALDFATPGPILRDCIAVATDAIGGLLQDTVKGCCFYKRFDCAWPADWGAPKQFSCKVGAHEFFDL